MVDLLEGLEDVLREHANKTADELKKKLAWTTNLKENITVTVDRNKYTIGMPLYAIFVEKGRKPNSKMPPTTSLKSWLENKGIPLSASFAIARSIGKKGIKPKPFIKQSFDLAALAEDVAKLIVKNINKNFEE